jgi:hypothetical protein
MVNPKEDAMVELRDDKLIFTFPEIHPEARLTVAFNRTLRIPDDGKTYPLPPGLGNFPVEHIDDYDGIPEAWIPYGGIMLPMYQSEALWLSFNSSWISDHEARYPFAIKIGTGKINAVTGEYWTNGLSKNPQGYLVVPGQPWLDGYCVERGIIRQFVALPLGAGYSAEEQITGKDEFGGIQIEVIPMNIDAFNDRWPVREKQSPILTFNESAPPRVTYCRSKKKHTMSLAPGGRMRQEIFEDQFKSFEWDRQTSSRCFVHLANSVQWKKITGKNPPTFPIAAKDYSEHGLPWFDYYSDLKPLPGSRVLSKLKSVFEKGKDEMDDPLPENNSASPQNIVPIQSDHHTTSIYKVREW